MDRRFPIYRSVNSLDVTDKQIEEAVEKAIKEEFDGFEVNDISVEVDDMTVYVELSNNKKGFGLYYKLKDQKLVLIDRKRFNNKSNPSSSQSIKNDFADKKPRWDLLPIEELAGVVDVYTAGAKKYGENRWQTLPNGVNRYMGAFFRHLTGLQARREL